MRCSEMKKIIQKEYTALCKMKISKKEVDFPKGLLKARFLNHIESSIRLLPLYGGGLNEDLEYEFIVVFQNGDLKAHWIEEKFENIIELRKNEVGNETKRTDR